jgi:protein-S-isoprenylcysteine O-methyltransferase Ste14
MSTKTPWTSLTIWGIAAQLVIVTLTGWMGLEIDEETKQTVIDNAVVAGGAISYIIATIITVWGRWGATKAISFSTPPVKNSKLP